MTGERPNDPDAVRLPEEAAQRILARSIELDARRHTELSVAQLREAAVEAGIAPEAFEQALREFRNVGQPIVELVAPRDRRSAAIVFMVVMAIILVGLLFVLFT